MYRIPMFRRVLGAPRIGNPSPFDTTQETESFPPGTGITQTRLMFPCLCQTVLNLTCLDRTQAAHVDEDAVIAAADLHADVQPKPTGRRSSMGPDDWAVLTVAADGLCLAHACCAAMDCGAYHGRSRDAEGTATFRPTRMKEAATALAFVERVCVRMDADGAHERAAALRAGDLPNGDTDLQYYAAEVGGLVFGY